MRTRMYGGVGGEEPRGFPLSRLTALAGKQLLVCIVDAAYALHVGHDENLWSLAGANTECQAEDDKTVYETTHVFHSCSGLLFYSSTAHEIIGTAYRGLALPNSNQARITRWFASTMAVATKAGDCGSPKRRSMASTRIAPAACSEGITCQNGYCEKRRNSSNTGVCRAASMAGEGSGL